MNKLNLVIRQHAIVLAKGDPYLCHYMKALGHNELACMLHGYDRQTAAWFQAHTFWSINMSV